MFKLFKIRAIVLKSVIGLAFVLSANIANATIILNFDNTSTSSNTPATGASARTELSFSDVAGQVKIDFNFRNTTGELTAFGAGATTSKLTGVGIDLISNTGVSGFVSGIRLDTLITNASLPPFGTFDIAIADNGNFLGGNANGALAEGQSDTASLILSGTGLSAVNLESAFLTGFSDKSLNFVARFQQVNAGAGSDKLEGGCIGGSDQCGDPQPPTAISEPVTLALLGLGLLGISVARKFGSSK